MSPQNLKIFTENIETGRDRHLIAITEMEKLMEKPAEPEEI
jgi:hypothetical protein